MAGSSAPPRPPRASPLARGFVNVFKRNSLYAGVVFGGSFLFAIFWEAGTRKVYESYNRGKLWKDIRHKYVEAE